MNVIAWKLVAVLLAAAHHERAEIVLVNRFVVREPDVAIDSEDAAFGFETLQYRIKSDYLINHRLNKNGKVITGFLIAGAVIRKPDPVVVTTQIKKEFYG